MPMSLGRRFSIGHPGAVIGFVDHGDWCRSDLELRWHFGLAAARSRTSPPVAVARGLFLPREPAVLRSRSHGCVLAQSSAIFGLTDIFDPEVGCERSRASGRVVMTVMFLIAEHLVLLDRIGI